jgi:hypothetical protein
MNENWKTGLLLLIPLFYRTVKKFVERLESVGPMKTRTPTATEQGKNPPQPQQEF